MRVQDVYERLQGFEDTASALAIKNKVRTVLVSVRVPSATNLVLTHFWNYIGQQDWTAWGNLVWSVEINGAPVRGHERRLDQYPDPNRELGVPIVARGGDLLEIVLTNESATTDYIGAVNVKGYYGVPAWE